MQASNENEELRLCSVCKDFYARQETNFLCSKCHRERQNEAKKEQETVQEAAQMAKKVSELSSPLKIPNTNSPVPSQSATVTSEEVKEIDVVKKEENSEMKEQQETQEVEKKVQTDQNKCWKCNRKVGLVKVPCKCEYVFCPKHRHAEAHDCQFDFFAEHKAKLEKQNQKIEHHKMEKMF